MKNHYLIRQRIRSAMVCLLLLSVFFVNTSFSQSQSGFDKGVVRIKVSEALAQQIESAKISRNANNQLITGIQSLDQVNNQFKAKAIRRVFRPAGKFEAKHRRHGLHLWYEIQIDQAASVLTALNAYKSLPQVVISEPSYKKQIIGADKKNFGPVVYKGNAAPNTLPGASNDPFLGSQWHYNNTGQTGGTAGADISLFQAWGIETGRSEVIVAITDGGVQVNHPDIAANMWVNVDEIPGNNIDDDNNGYIDDVNGYGFGDGTGTIAPDNHGTHVGGTIAAVTNNNLGVAGVAGGSGTGDGVRIMSCAAFGGTSNGGFADTYTYGADNGAVISQNSWGYTVPGVFEQAVLDGIDYFIAEAGLDENGAQVGPMHGGIVIFAAGNSDSNEQHYPGFYDACFAVSGTNHKDQKSWYTNFGPWVEVAAPGGETNTVAQQGVLSTLANNQYGFFQGTSMACPHVSGLAALIVSKFGGPGFSPNAVKARISSTTENIDALNPGFEGMLGVGRINAFAALQEDDDVAPLAISDLSTTLPQITSIWVKWTAPIDPGTGAAFSYDLRYSTSPITEANFESATAASGEPTPGIPGTTQEVQLTGLTPGTLYYFAIKSADFFGNTSSISNIAEGTTNFAPSIQIDPSSLTESLVTNEEKVRTIQVINNGDGPLSFTSRLLDGSHAQLSPGGGTVPAHSSLDVNVTLDARRLLAGTYSSDFWILSNDEAADSILYPVTLNVSNNGAPIAYMPVTNLDFDTAYIGHVNSAALEIINWGSDTLAVDSVSSTDPHFQYVATHTIKVGPFETKLLPFEYDADSLGQWSSELTVYTNDPANPTIGLQGYANVVDAPEISITPDSLYQQLNTNNTATQTLTIANNGGTDLHYTAEVGTSEAKVASVTKTITLPAKSPTATSGARKNNISTASKAQAIRLKSVEQSASVIRVLIVSPDDDVTDLEAILDSFEDIEADVYPKADLPSFGATAIEGYPIVITTNNTKWLENGGVTPEFIGDELATYVDIGGKVISNQFMYSYDDWKLAGRFIDGQYGPFIPSTTDANISVSLGTILEPGHPIMSGVSTLDYSGFVQNVGLAPGAVALANWSNGELFLAANGNVVALNLLPSLGNGGSLQWSGDLPTIYQNAIHYLAGPTFVSVSPQAGTIGAGSSADLTVTFDATNLDAGQYRAFVQIASNAPGAGLINVPAILDVLGPEFTISPDSIYAEVEQGGTTSETFVLSNNGFGNFNYNISVVDKGVSSVSVKKIAPAKAARIATTKRTQASGARVKLDVDGIQAIMSGSANGRSITAAQLSVDQYATDFEAFTEGDISGQEGWAGQFGNWTIESVNPSSGGQHFRGLADGFGFTLAFSPTVAIGSEEKSSVTMKVHRQDLGVTWQVIPQSPSAGFLNTRVEFSADGSAQVLINDGAGNAVFVPINAAVPLGYFDLTIEVDRATSEFKVYFNTTVVFEGLGFAGDIEQLVILSLMEIAGPTFDLDDVRIIDGTKDFAPAYITVAPNSGALNAGESVEVTVTFDASELEFGTYGAELLINIDGAAELTLPTTLRVFGDPAVAVNPTVLQNTVPYKGDSVLTFDIQNTGGNPLDYSMQVIGADTDIKKLAKSPVSKFATTKELARTADKAVKDASASRSVAKRKAALEIQTGLPLFTEDFEDASFPPADWSVVDNAGGGVVWNFAAAWGEGNYAGTGEAATASSDAAGDVEFDTELISPWIDAAGYKNIALQYNVNYQNFASRDFLNVDIQIAGASSWTNVLSWNEDHGTLRGTQSEFVSLTLDEFLAGATSFRVRWHYFDPEDGDFDWYAQIDDISILGDARAWLSVTPPSGTVPVRGTATISALFDAEDVEPGFYVAGVLVRSNAVNTPLVGVVASLEVMRPAAINVEPDDLKQKLFVGEVATQHIKIENQGESPLKFSFEASQNESAPETAKARVVSKNTRTTKTPSTIGADDRRAIRGNGTRKLEASELYGTGFEEFATGDIDGQEGWSGQFSNWTIETEKPAFGVQHFRGLADGLGQSLAFSPEVAIGTEAISSTTMKVNIDGSGVSWQVIPQSPSASFVNTRFEISADGSMRTLVDTLGGTYLPVPGTWPSGYNDLRIDIVRATKYFTIYLNNAPIFTGKGFAGDIEQVVILSAMEESGPTMDIDNLAILDGTPVAPWITVTPLSGVVGSSSSIDISVTFNAQDLDAGQYADTLNIASNDPATPWVQVPVFLTVDSNTPPELAPIPALTVLEKQIAQVTLTATDEDDSLVTVSIDSAPAFVTAAGSGNGTATFDIKPQLGDVGEYYITVKAIDARGAADYDTLHLSVLQFAVQSFSVVNIKTGQVITTFTDEVTLNRADANFNDLNIRANATPLTVGSVKFKVNGSQKNIDNTYEYFLKTNYLAGLGVGQYTLFGEPFTSMYGQGQRGVAKTATVKIINASTVVTNFSLVNTSTGVVVQNFADSITIDASRADFQQLNIRANTAPSVVGSVKFKINGSQRNIDNTLTYDLKSGALQSLINGSHTLLGEPWTQNYGQGQRGLGKTATITIINSGNAGRLAQEGISENTDLTLFPVPVIDQLTIDVAGKQIDGEVELVLVNTLGQLIHRVKVSPDKIHGFQISTNALGMVSGVYYLKLQSINFRQTKRFNKK